MRPTLAIVTCSTRPGRVGPKVADWFTGVGREHGGFDLRPVDLLELDLPLYDEPQHPRTREYRHEHTRRWSAIVDAADAFVFVTPEYNYSPPPSLVNALDYVYWEWHGKPAGLVSYGGLSGGLRASHTIKLTLTTLKVMPLPEQVAIPFVHRHIDGDRFVADDGQREAAGVMLDELRRWSDALVALR